MQNPIDSVIRGVGGPLDRLSINWQSHLAASLPDGPLTLPGTLADKLAEHGADDCSDDLCALFKLMTMAVHTGGYDYAYQTLRIGGDDSSLGFTQPVHVFYRTSGLYHTGDPFYSSESFLVVDDKVYALTDSNLAECGLLETNLGFWASSLRDTIDVRILDPINDRLSAGYSSYPYGELEDYLESGQDYETTFNGARVKARRPMAFWVESRQCYVARLRGIPFLCKVEPVAPYYGG